VKRLFRHSRCAKHTPRNILDVTPMKKRIIPLLALLYSITNLNAAQQPIVQPVRILPHNVTLIRETTIRNWRGVISETHKNIQTPGKSMQLFAAELSWPFVTNTGVAYSENRRFVFMGKQGVDHIIDQAHEIAEKTPEEIDFNVQQATLSAMRDPEKGESIKQIRKRARQTAHDLPVRIRWFRITDLPDYLVASEDEGENEPEGPAVTCYNWHDQPISHPPSQDEESPRKQRRLSPSSPCSSGISGKTKRKPARKRPRSHTPDAIPESQD